MPLIELAHGSDESCFIPHESGTSTSTIRSTTNMIGIPSVLGDRIVGPRLDVPQVHEYALLSETGAYSVIEASGVTGCVLPSVANEDPS
jgi:hypothetical protein